MDLFLRREGVTTTAESRTALLEDAAKARTEVAEKLKRNAEGDYRPDTNVEKFPAWEGVAETPKESRGGPTFEIILGKFVPAKPVLPSRPTHRESRST